MKQINKKQCYDSEKKASNLNENNSVKMRFELRPTFFYSQSQTIYKDFFKKKHDPIYIFKTVFFLLPTENSSYVEDLKSRTLVKRTLHSLCQRQISLGWR